MDAFVDPILREAVEKKGKKGAGSFEGEREVKEGESLLDHLIHYTEGEFQRIVAVTTIERPYFGE